MLVIDDPFVTQLLEEIADVAANLGGIGVSELRLQFCDDLVKSALAVATLDHQPAGALQANRTFGKQDHALLFAATLILRTCALCTPAATGRQARLAVIIRRRHVSGRPRDAEKANRNPALGLRDFV